MQYSCNNKNSYVQAYVQVSTKNGNTQKQTENKKVTGKGRIGWCDQEQLIDGSISYTESIPTLGDWSSMWWSSNKFNVSSEIWLRSGPAHRTRPHTSVLGIVWLFYWSKITKRKLCVDSNYLGLISSAEFNNFTALSCIIKLTPQRFDWRINTQD